jgi:transketolase
MSMTIPYAPPAEAVTSPATVAPGEHREVTARIREHIVDMCAGPEGGHVGGSMSLVEILTALYFNVLRIDPHFPGSPDRDVLLLSKGHGGIALYAALCEAGFFPPEDLAEYSRHGSHFMAHPHPEIAGVEMPSGSLGHGLALGIGFSLSIKLEQSDRRCFVVMGDGEQQEGSVWEAASVAAHHKLDNLTAVIDRNGLQITGRTESVSGLGDLAARWTAFGWDVHEVDGHDVLALTEALDAPPSGTGRPRLVIAHTVKGKGLPFIEGQTRSHYAKLGGKQHQRALSVLRSAGRRAGA